MTDPLTTQLPPAGTVPPTKRIRLDSVGDGADFYLEDLPDDLLVTSIDLPALDGPAGADLTNMTGLNSTSSQPQQLPGLNSTPPNSSQARIVQSNVSPVPIGAQQQTPQPLPATSASAGVKQGQPLPPSSTPVPLHNSNTPRVAGLTTSAGAPPNTTIISTSADPTPALPNISSTSAASYPANVANPLPSAAHGMATHPRGPPASVPYNSYVGGMTSSAPAITSQMNPMQPQQAQQVVNYMTSSGGLRHPATGPNMGPVPGQMVYTQRTMMGGQHNMMTIRQRQPMMHAVHGGSSMMASHPQQAMGMQHHSHIMTQQMGMGGGMMQPSHGGMHMPPNMHLSPYDPRTRMMQPNMMSKPGMSIHHHRMQNPHHMQHPAMHPGRMVPRSHVPGNQIQYVGDPSGYQGHMRGGYPVAPGQTALPPHSHSQMLNQQLSNTVPPNQQNMPTQQQQPPRPPSEGVPQGSPLPGQLSTAAGPQLQVATPPQQQQATPPHQQATPPQRTQGAAALNQQPLPTSQPATPQQAQQQTMQHQMSAPPTPASLQRSSPGQQASGPMSQPNLSPVPSHTQQVVPSPQQQQSPALSQQQTPPQNAGSQLLPPQSAAQPTIPHSQAANSLSLNPDPMQYLPGGGRVGNQQQPVGPSQKGPAGCLNSLAPGGGLATGGQPGTTDPEKRKLIQQQLVLLLHAHKCQRREREHSMGGGDYQPCSLPHCQTMKRVLNHMTECQAGRQCSYPHCASSRQIITHWKNCQKPDCPVCLPLKNAALPRKREDNQLRPTLPGGMNPPYSQPLGGSPQMAPSVRPMGPGGPPNCTIRQQGGGMMMQGGRPPLETLFETERLPVGLPTDVGGIDMTNPSRVPFSIPNIPNQQSQPWHQMVQPELRQHLVKKLVETIVPMQNPTVMQDQRVSSLIQYAMKVENVMFETASSREEYYKLLAEKIYRIRKELEDRKRNKLEMDKRRLMMEGLPMDGSIPNGGDGVSLGQGLYQAGRHPMASSPFSSQSQSPYQAGHTNSPSAPSGIADGNPSSLPPIDFLNSEDRKDGILPSTTASTSNNAKLLSPASVQPPSLPDLDIKSEMKSPPPAIHPPWSRQEAQPTTQPTTPSSDQKPIPSLPRAPTPREPVSSVKSRTGADNPPSVPPSLPPSVPPPSSRPATPSSKQMDGVPTPSKYKVVPDHSLKKDFSRDELIEALQPILDTVYNQTPEAVPFWDPVDPNGLGIPDYFDIIKNPMDLRTIRNRLEDGTYGNPWEFCNDMRLMFENAWLYNKKTSRVYKYCTKLVEVFDSTIDAAMMKLGYCCGQRHTFHPQVLYCYGKALCTIVRDGVYYCYQNRYIYCQKCFTELPGDTVTVGDDPTNTSEISKATFKEKKNDHVDYEPMVKCIHCGREFHSICILYHAGIWGEGYQCDGCLKTKGTTRRENKFCAKRLPTNKLSSFLEDRVNMFLRTMDSGSEVIIRTVSSFDKVVDTRPLMKDRFQGDFPEQFPYRTKAMFVFEEIDGCEVCFFGLHVQEYGSDCQAPNTRRVYISYLDSIHFFHPKHLRTLVYHEILIGYLQFCKNNGFMTAHIWACPPSEGDDYIFHCHPVEQKIPKPKRLVEWYRKMLDRGKSDNVVYDYRDIFKHCTEDAVTSVTEIPYFEGDFWPNIIEDTIKELDQEAREREASEAATVEGRGTKKAGKRGTTKKGSKKAGGTRSKSGKASGMMIRGDDLSQKIYTTMDKHKEVFFVVLLQPPAVCNSPISSTVDPDQLIPCDLMDGRDAFLTMARERHWEFSSLRRAKASTQAMLYELHNQGANFIYSCNGCGRSVETRYHCRECDDFDLCLSCYDTTKHEHPMEKLGLGMIDPEDQEATVEQDPQARKNASIQKAIEFLIHASQCRNSLCKIPSCIRMKRVLRHTRDCRLRAMANNCHICKQFLFLVYSHAKNCKENNCPLGGLCKTLKQNIRDTQAQQRRRSNLLMQQRIRSMQGMTGSTNGTSKAAGSPANTSPPTSKAPPPTPPQKGSPAIASPAGPRSVGKGGPRTPAGEMSGGKGATPKMAVSPSTAASKPDRSMPAPNVTVSMGGETIIQRVQQQPMMTGGGQREHELVNVLLNGNPMQREKVKQMMSQDPELNRNMIAIYRQRQQQRMEMGMAADMSPHQAASYNSQRPMSMMNVRPSQPGGYSQPHPQLMRAMPATHYAPPMSGYRNSYPQQVHHMVGPGQVYSQQTHHSSQLSRMLAQRPQVHTFQATPTGYSQMTPQPQPVGPPPQYMARGPAQPQTAGYPHMLSHHHQPQMQVHNPMNQSVGPMPTGHTHQYGTSHQAVPMDHGVPADANFVYGGNQQQTYSMNTNNNNSSSLSQDPYLTTADRLSTLSDLL